MDGLSVAASVIAIVQIAGSLIQELCRLKVSAEYRGVIRDLVEDVTELRDIASDIEKLYSASCPKECDKVRLRKRGLEGKLAKPIRDARARLSETEDFVKSHTGASSSIGGRVKAVVFRKADKEKLLAIHRHLRATCQNLSLRLFAINT